MQTKLVTVAEMQAIEREANAFGLSYETMMENAGRNLAEVVEDVYGYLAQDGICGLVGSGNNGGDTLVALACLAEEGWPAYAVLIRPRQADDPLIERLTKKGGIVYQAWDDPGHQNLKSQITGNAVIMDGVLGTGIHLPLKPEVAEPLEFAQKTIQEMSVPPIIVAVDCPSGIDCDSGGAAPESIPADLTVTMAAVKQGLFRFPANDLVGDLKVVGIGLPENEQELAAWKKIRTIVPDAEWVIPKMPNRPRDAHKGTFGTALVIAGSLNYTGAAWLAGQAAYRIGAGLVTLAVPEPLHATLAGQFPEATWLLLPDEGGVIDKDADGIIFDNLERVTAMLVGPGFGLSEATAEFLKRLLYNRSHQSMGFLVKASHNLQQDKIQLPPLVLDADGLKLLARIQDWPEKLPPLSILTPHPGEMSVLTGLSKEEIQATRLETALRYSHEWGHVVILKGAFTTIAAPDGQAAVIPVATPALARAGTGDVLAGLVVGLRAQGVDPFSAAVIGAWIHAQAGWRAAERLGNSASVLAGDVLEAVIQVISEDLV
jgi:ADP-dependent NAD(P)H-hydrate dehydratase / NAD(P)H-hydrate epimerase